MNPSFKRPETRPAHSLCVATLPQTIVEQIHTYTLDLLLDEHKQVAWNLLLPQSEFVRLRGYTVLFPVGAVQQLCLTTTHSYIETHENSLVFLVHEAFTASTPGEHPQAQTGGPSDRSFLLRCQKCPQQPFFITTLYHACWL